ncbi:hypothetical protein L0F63_004121, partial [Massospora cicadina]
MNNVNIIALVALVALTQARPVGETNILRRGNIEYKRPTPVSVNPAHKAYSSPGYGPKGSVGHAQGYVPFVPSNGVDDENAPQDLDSQSKGSDGKSSGQSSSPDGGKQVNQGPGQVIQEGDDSKPKGSDGKSSGQTSFPDGGKQVNQGP